MPLSNCAISLMLTWSEKYVLIQKTSNDTKTTTFPITETKLYFPVLTLSTQDNARLLQQLKSGFKRTINWNKFQSKVTTPASNPF